MQHDMLVSVMRRQVVMRMVDYKKHKATFRDGRNVHLFCVLRAFAQSYIPRSPPPFFLAKSLSCPGCSPIYNPPVSSSQRVGNTGVHHHTLVEMFLIFIRVIV